jgi:hypothetical protein
LSKLTPFKGIKDVFFATHYRCSGSGRPGLLTPSLYVLEQGGGQGQGVGLGSKGEGSWFQARDLSGWGFTTLIKTSVFQVSGFFSFSIRGYAQVFLITYLFSYTKQKKSSLCAGYK